MKIVERSSLMARHLPLTDRERAYFGPRNTKPAGSIAWCWQTLELLKIRWQRKDFTDQQFAETLEEVRQHEVWKTVPPAQPYGSLDALLDAEIGCTDADAQPHGGALTPPDTPLLHATMCNSAPDIRAMTQAV